ncbi:hypothetical protein R3P38DRAFT_2847691, partial [Favolaschia claudopus]
MPCPYQSLPCTKWRRAWYLLICIEYLTFFRSFLSCIPLTWPCTDYALHRRFVVIPSCKTLQIVYVCMLNITLLPFHVVYCYEFIVLSHSSLHLLSIHTRLARAAIQ